MQRQEQDIGDTTASSLTAVWADFVEALPRVLGFALILIIGWFVASLIAQGVAAMLRAVKFNDLAQRSGFSDFVQKMGIHTDASGFLALIAKWFIRLIVLVVAFDALGLPAVSDVLRQLLLWLPNLVVALVVLVLAGLVAKALSKLVRGATAKAELGNPDLLAKIAAGAVWAFAIVVAVNQLGIATTLVNTLFTGVIFALSLALGLAFGLGGKDTASDLLTQWRKKAEEAAPRIKQAAHEGAVQVRQGVAAAHPMTQDKIADQWTLLKGQIQARWNRLTDPDLDIPHGSSQYLSGKLQERYGQTPEQAQQDIQAFSSTLV